MAESDVFVRFGADIGPLEKGVNQASSKLNQISAKSRETANAMAKMSLAAAAAGTAIGIKLVSNSLAAIDAQAKLAKQLGTSSTSIATLNRAADMSGISMKQIEAGAKNLEVAMGEAAQGTGVAVDTLKRLNLTAKDLEGMTLDQKILTVNKALQENIPKAERAAAASDLFGKRAGFAISQLDAGTISEATRQVEGMGLAISDVDAAKVEAANDAMASIGMAVEGASQQLSIVLAPLLEDMALKFQEAAIETGGFRTQAVDAVNSVAGAIGLMADGIHGADVIISGLGVGFKTLEAVALEVVASIAEYFDSLTRGFANSINEMSSIAESITGIDLGKLVVGESGFVETVRSAATGATEELKEGMNALHNKMMEPMPSESLKTWVNEVLAASDRVKEIKNGQDDTPKEGAPVEAEFDVESLASVSNAKTEYERLLAMQQEFQELSKGAQTEFKDDQLVTDEQYANASRQIEENLSKAKLQLASSAFGNLSSLMQSENKKMFQAGKVAAIAQATIDGYSSVLSSYKHGAALGGPVLGAAFAATAGVATAVQISNISSASFGGGGGGSSSASFGSGQPNVPQQQQQQVSAPQPEQSRTVRIEGFNSDQLFTGDQLNSLAEKLVEYQEDGFKLVV